MLVIFDPGVRAFFTWEPVMMYLERAAVERTLRRIAGTAPGSAVAFDYFTAEPIDSPSPFWRYARTMIRVTGEPWKFGIDDTPPVRDPAGASQPRGLMNWPGSPD